MKVDKLSPRLTATVVSAALLAVMAAVSIPVPAYTILRLLNIQAIMPFCIFAVAVVWSVIVLDLVKVLLLKSRHKHTQRFMVKAMNIYYPAMEFRIKAESYSYWEGCNLTELEEYARAKLPINASKENLEAILKEFTDSLKLAGQKVAEDFYVLEIENLARFSELHRGFQVAPNTDIRATYKFIKEVEAVFFEEMEEAKEVAKKRVDELASFYEEVGTLPTFRNYGQLDSNVSQEQVLDSLRAARAAKNQVEDCLEV